MLQYAGSKGHLKHNRSYTKEQCFSFECPSNKWIVILNTSGVIHNKCIRVCFPEITLTALLFSPDIGVNYSEIKT